MPVYTSGRSLGQVAYETYLDFSGGTSLVTGRPLPEWDNSDPNIQQAWEHVAAAVADEVLRRTESEPDEET
jgi:hypothetical protein